MEFYLNDLRLVKPYMEELKESDPQRYARIIEKYNIIFKDMVPNSGKAPTIPEFLKDIFCNE
jgi:hypothetical protein